MVLGGTLRRAVLLTVIFFSNQVCCQNYNSYPNNYYIAWIVVGVATVIACIGAAVITICYCHSSCPLAKTNSVEGAVISLPQSGNNQVFVSSEQYEMTPNTNLYHNVPRNYVQQP